MTESEIRAVVRQVIAEERHAIDERMDAAVLRGVSLILTGFSMDTDEQKEVRSDFSYIRRLRRASEKIGNVGITAMITVLVGGFISALWLGFKAAVGK